MRKKIQRSMVLVITVTMLISYLLLTVVVYHQSVSIIEDEIRQEADYICKALEISGEEYLEPLDAVRKTTRITWIAKDGQVLYDSTEPVDNEEKMENHASRPEVKQALESGTGQEIRQSDTMGQELFYYAKRLEDGTVLRVSKPINTAFRSAVQVFPIMAEIGRAHV